MKFSFYVPSVLAKFVWSPIKARLVLPFVTLVLQYISAYRPKTTLVLNNVRDWIIKIAISIIVVALLFSLSVLMYVAFYYAYVPPISHILPLFFKFKTCSQNDGEHCSDMRYPVAEVFLSKEELKLMLGQPYKISIELEMPESPSNRQIGMFMICSHLFSDKFSYENFHSETIIRHSCRPAMLHYRSELLYFIKVVILSPLLLSGFLEEKQVVSVDLFSKFIEDESHPVSKFRIEIHSTTIEFYSANLLINAHFSGLRYFMFHWPLLSLIVGVAMNLFFTTIFCLISCYQLINSEEYNNYWLSHIEVADNMPSMDKQFEPEEEQTFLENSSSSLEKLRIQAPDSTEC